jgi:hypothetical protein
MRQRVADHFPGAAGGDFQAAVDGLDVGALLAVRAEAPVGDQAGFGGGFGGAGGEGEAGGA